MLEPQFFIDTDDHRTTLGTFIFGDAPRNQFINDRFRRLIRVAFEEPSIHLDI
jgi:hypothetical protein